MSVEVTVTLPRQRQAVGEARRLAASMLQELGAPTEHTEVISLALSEACTNAVEHSSGHAPFTLHIECQADSVRLTVTSSGTFEPATLEMPSPAALRGRGVPLMRTLMDEFDIIPGDASTTVTMCKRLSFPATTILLT